MTDRELLELIAAQVGVLTTNVDTLTNNVDNLTNNMDSLTKDVDTLKDNMNSLTKDVSELKEGQSNLENEIKEFRKETNTRFDNLEDKLNDLEGTNAANHVATNTKLIKISQNLDFLNHKEFQTEKEMFHLKQRLNKRNKNAK